MNLTTVRRTHLQYSPSGGQECNKAQKISQMVMSTTTINAIKVHTNKANSKKFIRHEESLKTRTEASLSNCLQSS
jgi:hypothetical protein